MNHYECPRLEADEPAAIYSSITEHKQLRQDNRRCDRKTEDEAASSFVSNLCKARHRKQLYVSNHGVASFCRRRGKKLNQVDSLVSAACSLPLLDSFWELSLAKVPLSPPRILDIPLSLYTRVSKNLKLHTLCQLGFDPYSWYFREDLHFPSLNLAELSVGKPSPSFTDNFFSENFH